MVHQFIAGSFIVSLVIEIVLRTSSGCFTIMFYFHCPNKQDLKRLVVSPNYSGMLNFRFLGEVQTLFPAMGLWRREGGQTTQALQRGANTVTTESNQYQTGSLLEESSRHQCHYMCCCSRFHTRILGLTPSISVNNLFYFIFWWPPSLWIPSQFLINTRSYFSFDKNAEMWR